MLPKSVEAGGAVTAAEGSAFVPDVDFTLRAREATERLGRKSTTADFRHLVLTGHAPLSIEGTKQRSQKAIPNGPTRKRRGRRRR
ncbi:hypothetical protein [Paenarthrobacter sp. NCHU4564]|uniref:hypothetical protein n=1 Tax=Paenarthrobacter sp. NCHU4564 TaxID=3451353 RepID=UPI003F980FEB